MGRYKRVMKWKKGVCLLMTAVMITTMSEAGALRNVQASSTESIAVDVPNADKASGIPGKPILQHNQYTGDTDGNYTITANMWYGNNGTYYVLYEKIGKLGEYKAVAEGELTDDSPNPQAFQIDIAGRTKPGTYYYYVDLMNPYGTTSSDEISLLVGSATTSKLEIEKIDANEIVNRYIMEQGTETLEIKYTETEAPEYEVISSNVSTVKAEIVNGNELRLEAVSGGRTGIKLLEKTTGEVRYFGIHVKEADGTLAMQPAYLSIGQVSEDSDADLNFWKATSEDDTNKRVDIRYIYINGGPIEGWRSWNPAEPEKRVKTYITESLKLGMVPYFVYYNIPDGSESYAIDYQHINDKEYMQAYYEDLVFFLDVCAQYDEGEQIGIILEPDFLGYMMQQGGKEPDELPAVGVESVYTSGILTKGKDPDFPNTLTGLVESINYIISTRYPSATFGWQFNTWGFTGAPSKGLMHATEEFGMENGRAFIERAATETAEYYMSAGILKYGADFISIDKYGLDGAYEGGAAENPASSSWLWNSDIWNNYLFYTKILHEKTERPVTLWQMPVGHLNHSLEPNPYNGSTFADLENVEQHYEDSAATFFFGDTFEPGMQARMEYFSRNDCNDSKISVNGDTITYGSHMEEAAEAGITCILFGAGVGSSTDAVGEPPTDDYFWITKAQRYYKNPVALTTNGSTGGGGTTTDPEEGETPTNPEQGGTTTDPEQGGTTTEPEEGETPTNPEEGGTTTEPEEGETPTNPEQGGTTTDPEEDGTPTNPEEGGTTTDPEEGETPTNPEQGGTTTDPEEGETPTNPEEGGTTTDPEQGGTTTDPEEGEAPTNPEQGGTTTEPEGGGTPTNPEQGGTTTDPEEGETPTNPEEGGTTTNPEQGGTMTDPEEGGTPTNPETGGITTTPETSQTGTENTGAQNGNNSTTDKSTETVYTITYQLNGGTNHINNPQVSSGQTITLYSPSRKGYTFEGWFLDCTYQTEFISNVSQVRGDSTLYAKWKKVTLKKPVIKKLKSKNGKKLMVTMKKQSNVDGYEIVCALDKKFKKSRKIIRGKKNQQTFKKLKSKKVYYVKVRTYKKDSTGENVYSKYSKVKKYRVK